MISVPYPVTSARCITINSDSQIYVYPTDTTRDTYILFGDTWKKTATTFSTRAYDFSTMVCQNINDGLPYKRPETEIYFNILAIVSFCILAFLAIRLIIYKFWRKI